MTVCVDTNTLIQIFGRQAAHHPIRIALLAGRLTLALSNEIHFEYREVVTRMLGPQAWRELVRALEIMEDLYANVVHAEPQFRFNIITADADDNKFTDCAVAANADFVITEDKHFAVLINAGYRPQPITPHEFILPVSRAPHFLKASLPAPPGSGRVRFPEGQGMRGG